MVSVYELIYEDLTKYIVNMYFYRVRDSVTRMKLNETTQSKIDEKVIQLSEKNKELLDVLTNIPEVSQSMIAKELNWDVNTVKYYTKKLKKMGILERTGSSRKGSWIVKKQKIPLQSTLTYLIISSGEVCKPPDNYYVSNIKDLQATRTAHNNETDDWY